MTETIAITATREELAEAFEEWRRRYEADPSQFGNDPDTTYGQGCADFLIELITEAVRSCRGCGCTDAVACEGGCSWVEPDLCSRCGS